jgi:hypothetical protein
MLILVGFMFLLIHIFKALRFYLIMMENKVELTQFIRLYLKTTLVNILFPFKLGEIFRIYAFGKHIKNYRFSTLGVITERFFDACILLLLLVPFEVIKFKEVNLVSIYLLLFVCITSLLFFGFQSTYLYLNKFLITRAATQKGITALKYLEISRRWHQHIKELIKGRSFFLLVLSLAAWVTEFIMLGVLCKILRLPYNFSVFADYMNNVFVGETEKINTLSYYYMLGSSVFFLLCMTISYMVYYRKRGVVHGK